MNQLAKILVFRVSLIAAFVTALTLLNRLRNDPSLRADLAWAVRSWFTPPDADARWEQNHADRPAWQQDRQR